MSADFSEAEGNSCITSNQRISHKDTYCGRRRFMKEYNPVGVFPALENLNSNE